MPISTQINPSWREHSVEKWTISTTNSGKYDNIFYFNQKGFTVRFETTKITNSSVRMIQTRKFCET